MNRRATRCTSWLFLLVLIGSCQKPESSPASLPEEPTVLLPGFREVRSLPEGRSVAYRAEMTAGDLLHLRIEQRGLDVEILWPGFPQNLDLPYGSFVTEEIWWSASEPGELSFEVRAGAGHGDYLLTVERLGPADDLRQRCAEIFRRSQATPPADETLPARTLRLEELARAWQATPCWTQEALAWARLSESQYDLDDLDAATESLDRALGALVEPASEPVLDARLHFQRGRLRQEAGLHKDALEDLLAAAEGTARAGDLFGFTLSVNHMAVTRYHQGELSEACEGYERSLSLYDTFDPAEATRALLNLGRCYARLGSLEEAPAALEEALRRAGDLPGGRMLQAEILREISWWQRLEGQSLEALWILMEAYALAPDLPGILDRIGTTYSDLGELALARRYYDAALERAQGSKRSLGHVHLNLCRLEAREGQVEAALEHCQTAALIFDELNTPDAADARLLSAEILRDHDLPRAEAMAEQALFSVEERRGRMGPERQRKAFLAERLDAHELTIDLRMELHAQQPRRNWDVRALQVSELTRARSLLDLLRRKEVVAEGPGPSALAVAEEKLRARITAGDQALAEASADTRHHRLMDLVLLQEQLAALRERRHRESAFGPRTEPCVLDTDAIRSLLDAETLLLVYHLGERKSYLWSVDRGGVDGQSIGETAPIERLARTWYAALADVQTYPWTKDRRRSWAHGLSQALLGPVRERLRRFRRLLIVGEGVLLRIPFGALPLDAADGPPVIAEHEVVSLPSVCLLTTLRQQLSERRPAEGLLAVVADPVFSPDPAGNKNTNSRRARYPRLLASAEEARLLLDLAAPAPTLLLERHEARLSRILGGELEGFRILHFATHAEIQGDSDRPLGLLLSQVDPEGRSIEGLLGLQELYNLNLPAELAVLSACSTALGQEVRGEGLVGLTRGFMHAGTPRVLVSLWDVEDRAALEVMGLFYRHLLQDSLPPPEALRRTQQDLWRRGRPEATWAAWVLQGDWSPLTNLP